MFFQADTINVAVQFNPGEKNLSYLLFNLNHGQRLALQVSLRGTKLPGDDMEAVTGLHGQIKGCNAHFYSITQCACYTA